MNKLLLIVIAIIVIIAGFYYVTRHNNSQNQSYNSSNNNQQASQQPDFTIQDIPGSTNKIYNNTKYNFKLVFPNTFTDVGTVATNSALGTAQNPVKGIKLGPLVMVVANNSDLKEKAENNFNGYAQESGCVKMHVNNNLINADYVYCTGGGGPAYYALAKNASFEIFFDGYSQGAGRILSRNQLGNILSSLQIKLINYTDNITGLTIKYPEQYQLNTSDGIKLYGTNNWPHIEILWGIGRSVPSGESVKDWVLKDMPNPVKGYQSIAASRSIAGYDTLHLTFPGCYNNCQTFPSDAYYFIRGGVLYEIQLIHTIFNPDWTIYNQFLDNISFK